MAFEEASISSKEVVDMQIGRCDGVRLGENINYICVGVALRDNNGSLELLMEQEAKRRCYGKWYVPSGRIERGETITDGIIREVREETGYLCVPEELICLQVQGSGWYRFVFYCNIIDGRRKTIADAESLCSDWIPVEDVKAKKIEVRCNDFLKVLDEGIRYHTWRQTQAQVVPRFLPVAAPVNGLFIEFLIVRSVDSRNEILIHSSISDTTQLAEADNAFPLAEFGFEFFFPTVVSKCFQHMLQDGRNAIEIPSSVTRVQCLPKPADGFRHGIRVRIVCLHKKSHSRAASIKDPHRYRWVAVTDETLSALYLGPDQFRPSLILL